MTTKIIKTVLFASLIVAMILPFSGMNLANAQQADQDKITDIPEDQLIQRQGENWKKQYQSIEEFDIAQNSIEQYVNADLPNNGWNQAMQKANMRLHNFDSLVDKKELL